VKKELAFLAAIAWAPANEENQVSVYRSIIGYIFYFTLFHSLITGFLHSDERVK
jgi:hypothetical protein